jgi:hypothetical protein
MAGRTRRGGVRTGTQGVNYSNRTDLNANRTLPAAAPTGLGYGERKQLMDSQQQVPLRPAPGAPPVLAAPGPEALGLGVAGGSGRLADVIAAAAQSSGASDLEFLAQRARTLGQ